MTISDAQKNVDQWISTYGVRYFNELTNMAMLTEEVGEVARIIARRYGEQSEKESDKSKDLGDEMADVLMGVDLSGQPNRRGSYRRLQPQSGQENRPGQYEAFRQSQARLNITASTRLE
jgi:NTP pyrophosphatase (non-canonical NTP hydrolase)